MSIRKTTVRKAFGRQPISPKPHGPCRHSPKEVVLAEAADLRAAGNPGCARRAMLIARSLMGFGVLLPLATKVRTHNNRVRQGYDEQHRAIEPPQKKVPSFFVSNGGWQDAYQGNEYKKGQDGSPPGVIERACCISYRSGRHLRSATFAQDAA